MKIKDLESKVAELQRRIELMEAREAKNHAAVDRMVNRFLSWPLPSSVCADACAMDRNYPHRSGTNLLTAIEAKQMIEHIIA